MSSLVRRPLSCIVALLSAFALVGVGVAFQNKDATPTFAEHLIADKYGYAFGVAAADLDGDGDLDLVSCDTTNNVLYWFENDGKGKFTRHVIQDNEKGWFERHAVGDLDGDGEPDVVVVKNLDGHLVWFSNGGKGKKWTRHVITTDCKRAYDVALADVDGDGKLDVIASAWTGNHFAWFENPGKAGHDKEWKRHLIDDGIAETRTVRVADFNGDRRPDVLGTARAGNLVAWYENPGKGEKGKWTRHVIDDKSTSPTHGHPIDMDGDGDVDVVMAVGMLQPTGAKDTNQVVWYENVGKPGDGTKWKKHVIGELVGAFEAYAADLNGDGKPDVVATAWGPGGKVVWYENPGDPAGKWTMHVLKEKWVNANQVIVADLDGDRRPDIIATAERGSNELRWWRNVGKKR